MKIVKLLTIFFAITMLVGMLGGSPAVNAGSLSPNAVTEAKIGLLAGLTGGLGPLGPTFVNAAEMAIGDLTEKYPAVTWELVTVDSGTSATVTSTAVVTLITAGVSGVIGAASSTASLAANEKLKAAGIPQISYASTSPLLTTAEDEGYLFRIVPSDAFQGIMAAQFLIEIGVKDVAVIALDDPYGQGLAGAFIDNFGDPVVTIAYDGETEVDFADEVTQLVDSDPDAIYAVTFIVDGGEILSELALAGYDGLIFGADGIGSSSMFDIAGVNASMSGMTGTFPKFGGTDTFKADYLAEFGIATNIFVAEVYDATMIMGEAIIAADSNVGSDVKDALLGVGTNYQGVTGSISFDEVGDLKGGKYEVWQVHTDATGNAALDIVGAWDPATEVFTITLADLDQSKFPTELTEATFTGQDKPDSGEEESPLDIYSALIGLGMFMLVVRFRRRK